MPPRSIGYYEPYATRHAAFDKDEALREEIRNAARALIIHVKNRRLGVREVAEGLTNPRPK